MKVQSVALRDFKRFSDLTISGIPEEAKLVIVVGPNGSGKSSLFDAFTRYYYAHSRRGWGSDDAYYKKSNAKTFQWDRSVSVRFHGNVSTDPLPNGAMYFRTAHRNDPDFKVSQINRMNAPHEETRIQRFIDNDRSVQANYQRLIYNTISGVYSEINADMLVGQLKEELIGAVRDSMHRVFDDLVLNSIVDPIGDGSFFFQKGEVDAFHYKNLSGGEKAAFDLLLDMNVKLSYYDDSIFFIDEPEMHMHTSLQGRLIEELYRLVPNQSQLWVATHSLGIMRRARELSRDDANSVVFIDFGGHDFDGSVDMRPVSMDGLIWEKFLSFALDDLASIIAPETIVICEGDPNGRGRRDYDARIYRAVFGRKYPEVEFISGGSCNDIRKPDHVGYRLLAELLKSTHVVRLIDRDDLSDTQVQDLATEGILVTSLRHLESYLLSDELIEKLVSSEGQTDLVDEALVIKTKALQSCRDRGLPKDDVKHAAPEICKGLCTLLGLTRRGNTSDAFMRDTMAPLLTEDTKTYGELHSCVIEAAKRLETS